MLERLRVDLGDPQNIKKKNNWGEKYYRGATEVAPGIEIGVDLFVVTPPAEWGVVYLIRTGSAQFSQAVVTRLHRWGLRSEQGRIVRTDSGEVLRCPDESTFFRYARLPWITPRLRDSSVPEFELAFSREWEPGQELEVTV